MATPTEKLEIIRVSLTELRRFYDHVSNIYDQLRVKTLGLMAGEVAIVSFIFANGTNLTIPEDADRQFFFWTALVFLAGAFAIFIKIISTMEWIIPHDLETSKEIYANQNHNSELAFIEYLHDDYISSINTCKPKIEDKNRIFNKAIYLLAAGVIILMVIKVGAPNNDTKGVEHMKKQGTSITKGA